MHFLRFTLLCLLLPFARAQETPSPEDQLLTVFVLTGQSNSLGTLGTTDLGMRHDPVGSHPAEQAGGVSFFWDNRSDGTPAGDAALGSSGAWVNMGAQTGGFYAGNDDHWGPEIGFSRMLWNAGYRHFAVVKASRGGGGNSFWQKESADHHMYDHVVSVVNAALVQLPPGYTGHRIAGLIYVQGESNGVTEAAEADLRFSALLENLRADLPAATGMQGVFGEIGGSGTNRDTTRAKQLALAQARTDIGYAENTGLSVHNQDGQSIHYDAESQILIGERMAAEAITLGCLPTKPLPAWSSLHAWYVADSGSSFDTSNAISRWASLHDGGAVRDLARKVAGQTYRRSVNSGSDATRKVVRFDGTNDLWANASTEFGSITGARSVALLCRVTSGNDGFLFDGATSSGRTRAQVRSNSWQAGATPASGSWNAAETTTVSRSRDLWQQHVFSYQPNGSGGTTVSHWIDGVLASTVTDAGDATLGGFILGSNGGSPFSRLSSDIAEVAVYRSALGSAEVAGLKSGWDARWGQIKGPPFAVRVSQTPREIARFGRHVLLGIEIDSDASNTTTLEKIEITFPAGVRDKIKGIALVDGDSGAALTSLLEPGSDSFEFTVALPLIEGTRKLELQVEPNRNAPLGSVIDAEVTELLFSGVHAGAIVPEDPAGVLSLGLVPAFTDVVKRGEAGIPDFRIPGIVCDADGILHAVYDHRYTGGAAGGADLPGNIDVGYCRSSDGGATWSETRAIMDYDSSVAGSSGNGVGDPCILRDPVTDTLWVAALWSFGNRAYNGSGAGTLPGETGQYVLAKSEDGGATWSAPINVTVEVKDDPGWRLIFDGPGHGLALRDGTLVFPSQYRDASGTVRVCSVFSSDHGATWDFGAGVPTASPQTNENTVCELDDGDLLFSMRTPSGSNGQRAWIRYMPQGAVPMRDGSWGSLFRLPAVPDAVCQGSVIQWQSVHRGDPRELVLFGNPASSSSRSNFTLRVSADGGNTWPVSRQLYAGSAAYSSICILPDHSIGVLFEKDDYNKITFARVEASWLYSPSADGDSDGMPDGWELLNGLNSAANDAALDSDGDGMSNLQEYISGTNPLSADSVLKTLGFSRGEAHEITWASVPGKSYLIEKSPDLVSWIASGDPVLARGASCTVSLPDDGGEEGFYRVKVVD